MKDRFGVELSNLNLGFQSSQREANELTNSFTKYLTDYLRESKMSLCVCGLISLYMWSYISMYVVLYLCVCGHISLYMCSYISVYVVLYLCIRDLISMCMWSYISVYVVLCLCVCGLISLYM